MNRRLVAAVVVLSLAMALMVSGCPGAARKPGVPGGKQGQEPQISLYVDETGAIKKVPLETYLEGVVAAEMDPQWPKEALAAQAILARTFTLKKIQDGGVKKRGTDASTNVEEFQAYDASRVNDRVREAVKGTRGMVVTQGGRYINGWFFADGGGRTAASAEEGLAFKKERAPYIKSVEDPGFKITTPENRSWTASFPLAEVRQAVKKTAGTDPGPIHSVKVVKRGPSGRVMTLGVNQVRISGPALRLALGSEEMRSTLLTDLKVEGGSLVMKGRGYGHGVGMSQWGARALAERGQKAEDIVSYFFRNVEIQRVW